VENAKVTFGGFAWIGSALPEFGVSAVSNPDEKTLEMNRFGGFGKVDYKANDVTVKFRGEFLMASTEKLGSDDVEDVYSVDGQAFFAHLGVQPSPQVEFLARYDFHDPDKDMEFVKDESDDDEESWLTVGVNYYLDGINAMFYVNFIHKMEPGQKNVGGETEDREFDNDQIVAQVQIVF
jgi:hypothetical protein